MKKVIMYTDGSCLGNPGPGGWGTVLRFGEHVLELSGGYKHTTNNRMELLAAIEGLAALKERCSVELYTDSQYVRNAVEKQWLTGWKKNGWKNAAKKPVKNRDLWERLDACLTLHDVHLHWVKGHAGNPDNERCDELARDGASKGNLQEDAGMNEGRE